VAVLEDILVLAETMTMVAEMDIQAAEALAVVEVFLLAVVALVAAVLVCLDKVQAALVALADMHLLQQVAEEVLEEVTAVTLTIVL
jgi:hypothetical protein